MLSCQQNDCRGSVLNGTLNPDPGTLPPFAYAAPLDAAQIDHDYAESACIHHEISRLPGFLNRTPTNPQQTIQNDPGAGSGLRVKRIGSVDIGGSFEVGGATAGQAAGERLIEAGKSGCERGVGRRKRSGTGRQSPLREEAMEGGDGRSSH